MLFVQPPNEQTLHQSATEVFVHYPQKHEAFDPAMFQSVLPKIFIRHMLPGEPLYAFFDAWKAAWRETVAMKVFGPRQWFRAAAKKLEEQGTPMDVSPKLLSLGLLRLKSSAGFPPVEWNPMTAYLPRGKGGLSDHPLLLSTSTNA